MNGNIEQVSLTNGLESSFYNVHGSMISIKNKKKCSGCSACASICPTNSISMIADEEGFLYPSVDIMKCIGCNLCDKTCPFLNPFKKNILKSHIFAAVSNDSLIRRESSSGGVFSELAKIILERGGVIFGAVFDDNWNVCHSYIDKYDSLKKLMKSKYVQSVIGESYRATQVRLREGKSVLFAGTSCQIAGLRHFLRKDYENLVTLEILYHGSPSPYIWHLYLDSQVKRYGYSISDIKSVSFRDKVEGMTEYKISIEMNDRKVISHFFYEDAYMNAFLSNLVLRPSCHSCKAKNGCSGSDLIVGDLWNRYHKAPFNDSNGTSVVLVNTNKGLSLLKQCNLTISEIGYDVVGFNKNSGFQEKQFVNPYRKKFFREVNQNNVQDLLRIYSDIPFYWRIIRRIKRIFKI